MAQKTILLDASEFIDFELYGIVSSFSHSPQFVFHLNKFFETRFYRIEDLDVYFHGETSYYPVYRWEDVQSGCDYHIIKNIAYSLGNQSINHKKLKLFDVEIAPALIQQHKEYNYLLKVTGEQEKWIKENSFIQKITKFDVNNIKSIDRLIF